MRKELVLIFGVALATRSLFSLLQIFYGLHNIFWLPQLSAWQDFYEGYAPWLENLNQGLLPYRDFYGYTYPPLFLYALYPFYIAGGIHAAAIPIVISDATTAPIVYLIAREYAKNRIALAAGFIYAVSPFALFYEGYVWLSSQPMTFFLILAIYLLKSNRPVASFATLAAAVLFKQEALFILPPFLIVYGKEYKWKIMRGMVIFGALLIGVSLPFLILAPKAFIYSISYYPIVNLGPPEPSRLLLPGLSSTSQIAGQASETCRNTTFPGLFTGTVCGNIISLPQWVSSLTEAKINQMAFFLAPFLFVLFSFGVFAIRRTPNILQVASAYSNVGFLIVFSRIVHTALAYNFLPVYPLLLASASDLRTLVVGVSATAISVVTPEGPFQVILPLASLFLVTIFQDSQSTKTKLDQPARRNILRSKNFRMTPPPR